MFVALFIPVIAAGVVVGGMYIAGHVMTYLN